MEIPVASAVTCLERKDSEICKQGPGQQKAWKSSYREVKEISGRSRASCVQWCSVSTCRSSAHRVESRDVSCRTGRKTRQGEEASPGCTFLLLIGGHNHSQQSTQNSGISDISHRSLQLNAFKSVSLSLLPSDFFTLIIDTMPGEHGPVRFWQYASPVITRVAFVALRRLHS